MSTTNRKAKRTKPAIPKPIAAIVRGVVKEEEADLVERLATFLLTLTEPDPGKPPHSLD